ncbi:Metallo-dependent phosphatase-like protein [Dactylonectria estremocensis]|uniref:Metallo-dependent phosphatase-like protein n=1 Tax=Dactylonectria estremocensis TaxID=1079267 RepID=A0A9P9FA75_9HYPO|nr:Metallo-dependent phosphatase-like protein [Dactylonectria estremocensis]
MVMIGAAQRRFLVFTSTVFFVASLYFCVNRLLNTTSLDPPEKPESPVIPEIPSKPLPSIHVEFSKADLPMSFGTFARPGYDGINMLAELPKELIPTEANGRRLIVIGDIHGMIDPLNQLLEKTEFDLAHDHLISVGDMVNKGPKSSDVVSRLMELKASAVRGNHEDRVLVAWTSINEQQGVQAVLDSDFAAQQRGESFDRKTARSLNETQIQWLKDLPVILTVDAMSTVSLAQQDPWAVMNMRTMRFPRVEFREEEETKRRKAEEKKKQEEEKKKQEEAEAEKKKQETQQRGPVKRNRHKRGEGSEDFDRSAEAGFLKAAASAVATPTVSSEGVTSPESTLLTQPDHDIWIPVDTRVGEPWANVWNHFQKKVPKSKRRSIIYGHDAHRGYQEDSYSFGLDSGCVKGNTLTALVIEARNSGWTYEKIHVDCTAP